jgi:hypothetical protein
MIGGGASAALDTLFSALRARRRRLSMCAGGKRIVRQGASARESL